MKMKTFLCSAAASFVAFAASAQAANDVRIVGSSTVYPFSTKVAQEYKNKTGNTVVVESTGSGGGHKLFCAGVGTSHPDITNSSRRQKKSEFNKCGENDVSDIVEVKIGYDGIVLANSANAEVVNLELKHVFLAFAKDVPISNSDCTLQANPYQKWSDIDASLPAANIEAYGPPPTSGTRDAFVEVAMERGARKVSCLGALRRSDKKAFQDIAHNIREDGRWIDTAEHDGSAIQTLVDNPTAVGIFGYSFLAQNSGVIQGALINDAEPTFENIAAGAYPISRSLFFYLKKANVKAKSGLHGFALEFTSDAAAAPGGYLEKLGLVPLPDMERARYRKAVEELTSYKQ